MNAWTLVVAAGLMMSGGEAMDGRHAMRSGDPAPIATCGTATLRDVEVVTGRVPTPSIATVHDTRRRGRGRDGFMVVTPGERRDRRYLVTIELDDMTYTGESAGNAFWEFNPTRLVINDPIEACVAKDTLRLRRPDGKDYKTKIVRALRSAHEASFEPSIESVRR